MEREYQTFLLRGKSVLFVKVWINDQHIWSGTGAQGDEQTLHNLVCHSQPEGSGCVNPKREKGGQIYPDKDSWEKRTQKIEQLMKDMENSILVMELDKIGAEDRAYKTMNRLDDEPCAGNDKYIKKISQLRFRLYQRTFKLEIINKPWANGPTISLYQELNKQRHVESLIIHRLNSTRQKR